MGLLLCNNTMTATAPELGVIDQRLLWVERVCLEDQRRYSSVQISIRLFSGQNRLVGRTDTG